MKAVQLTSQSDWPVYIDVPAPTPGEGDVVVRIRAAGVCRTDLHLIQRGRGDLRLPRTLGHEIAGEVVARGLHADSVREGERVVVHHKLVCGSCGPCRKGRETLCSNAHVLGIDLDGGFAEYVAARATRLVSLPASITFEQGAALTCGGVTAYHALNGVAGLRPAESTLVLGAGGVGLFAVQIAKGIGAKVTAADIREAALDRAGALGADRTVRVDPSDPARLPNQLGQDRFDVVLDLVGDSRMANSFVQRLSPGGRYIVTSGRPEDRNEFAPFPLFRAEQGILGSRGSSLDDLRAVVSMATQGALDSSIAITAPLEEAARVLHDFDAGAYVGRAVLVP